MLCFYSGFPVVPLDIMGAVLRDSGFDTDSVEEAGFLILGWMWVPCSWPRQTGEGSVLTTPGGSKSSLMPAHADSEEFPLQWGWKSRAALSCLVDAEWLLSNPCLSWQAAPFPALWPESRLFLELALCLHLLAFLVWWLLDLQVWDQTEEKPRDSPPCPPMALMS